MESGGSKQDNPFIEIVVTIGETLISVLRRLGFSQDEAEKAATYFSGNPTSPNYVPGLAKNADGVSIFAFNPIATANGSSSGSSGTTSGSTSTTKISSSFLDAVKNAVSGAINNATDSVPVQNLVTGEIGPTRVPKSRDTNGNGVFDYYDDPVAFGGPAPSATSSGATSPAEPSYSSSPGSSYDGGTAIESDFIPTPTQSSGTPAPAAAPTPPPPPPTVMNPEIPNQAKYSDAQWEAAKQKAIGQISANMHSVPLFEPDGVTYTGLFIDGDGNTYTPTDYNQNGINDQQEAWYAAQGKPFPDANGNNIDDNMETPPAPSAPPTVMNPTLPNQDKYTDAQWEAAKLKAMASIPANAHSVALVEPDGVTYSGVFITRDGNTYIPTDTNQDGINDQQAAWYAERGLAFPDANNNKIDDNIENLGQSPAPNPSPDPAPNPTTPTDKNDQPAPTPPPAGWDDFTFAEWEKTMLDTMNSIGKNGNNKHSVALPKPDGTYSGVFITFDGVTYSPTNNEGLSDQDGLNDQQRAWYRQEGIPLPGSTSPTPDPTPDPGPNPNPNPTPTPDPAKPPIMNPAPTNYYDFTEDQWRQVMESTMVKIPSNAHSVALLDPSGKFSGLFITRDGNVYTPTDTNGDGINDQQAAWYAERGLAFPDANNNKIDDNIEGYTAPNPDPGPNPNPNPGDLNDHPAPNPAPAGWDNFTFAQWEKAMLDAMDSIGTNGNNQHSVALLAPDGSYSSVYITKDGVTYTPTNNEGLSDQDGLNDQQRAWYRQEGIPLPGSGTNPDPTPDPTPNPTPDPTKPPIINPTPSNYYNFTEDQWRQAMQQAMSSVASGKHSVALADPSGGYSGLFITKDGIVYTPTDNNGDGLNDQQQAFMTEQAMMTIDDNHFGAPIAIHDTGGYSGVYVDRQGNTYTPTNNDGDNYEDHDQEWMAIKTMNSIPAGSRSAPLPNPDGTYSGYYITKDGNKFTPTDADNNGILDQDEAAYVQQAVSTIGAFQNGAPLADANGNWTGQLVDRNGNKYYPTDTDGSGFDDRDDQYAAQESVRRITNGHSGPLYDPNGNETGLYITSDYVKFTPTWDQGPFNNNASALVEDHYEQKLIQDAVGTIPAGGYGAPVADNGNWLYYNVDRGGNPYVPVDVNGNGIEDHVESLGTTPL